MQLPFKEQQYDFFPLIYIFKKESYSTPPCLKGSGDVRSGSVAVTTVLPDGLDYGSIPLRGQGTK